MHYRRAFESNHMDIFGQIKKYLQAHSCLI
jgi:hypothetical protein